MRAHRRSAASINAAERRRILIPELETAPAPSGGARFELVWEGRAMGTSWRVRAYGDAPRAAGYADTARFIAQQLDRVVRQMSHYDPESDLSRFNRAPAGAWVELPQEMFEVLQCSLEVARASHGWFEPTVGEAVSLWGFGATAISALPGGKQVDDARRRSGWHRLRLDVVRRAAWQPGGLQLNLSAIAKGFAADLILGGLRQRGLAAALVDVGGELAAYGLKPGGMPWWIEFESPPAAEPSPPRTLLALHEAAAASSGVWVQRRQVGKRVLSHLIDPMTGAPTENSTAGATVIHRSCMVADAWATALTVAPPRLARQLARRHGLAARLLVVSRGQLQEWLSPALRALEE